MITYRRPLLVGCCVSDIVPNGKVQTFGIQTPLCQDIAIATSVF